MPQIPTHRKAIDNKVDCWFCGRQAMEPKGDYYHCQACGATWNPMPEFGPPAAYLLPVPVSVRKIQGYKTSWKPSRRRKTSHGH